MKDPYNDWQEFMDAFHAEFANKKNPGVFRKDLTTNVEKVRSFAEQHGYIAIAEHGEYDIGLNGYVFLKPGTEYMALTDVDSNGGGSWFHSSEVEP